MELSAGLPDDMDRLVARLQDSTVSDEEREKCLRQLRPQLLALAAETADEKGEDHTQKWAASCLDGEFIERGVEHVLSKLPQYDASQGRFGGWARKTLLNLALDFRRKARRDPLSRAAGASFDSLQQVEGRQPGETSQHDPAQSARDKLETKFRQIREALARLDRMPARKVNYTAVFLLDLRIRILLCAWRVWGDVAGGVAREWVDNHLPWEPADAGISLGEGWPPLSEVWDEVSTIEFRTPQKMSDILERLNECRSENEFVTASLWNQWTLRARQRVQQQLGQEEWQRLFAWFWPTAGGRLKKGEHHDGIT